VHADHGGRIGLDGCILGYVISDGDEEGVLARRLATGLLLKAPRAKRSPWGGETGIYRTALAQKRADVYPTESQEKSSISSPLGARGNLENVETSEAREAKLIWADQVKARSQMRPRNLTVIVLGIGEFRMEEGREG
jgi:hypothetical protein